MTDEVKKLSVDHTFTIVQRVCLVGLLKSNFKEGNFSTLTIASAVEEKINVGPAEIKEINLTFLDNGQSVNFDIEKNLASGKCFTISKKEDALITGMFTKMNTEMKLINSQPVLQLYAMFVDPSQN